MTFPARTPLGSTGLTGLLTTCLALTLPGLALAAPLDSEGANTEAKEAAPAEEEAVAPADSGAADETASLSARGSLSTDGVDASSTASADGAPSKGVDSHEMKRTDLPWLKRWAPERNMLEVGLYGGLFFPASNHDFYNPASRPQKPLWLLNGSAGLRLAFFPLEYLGIEAEGGVMPSRIRNSTNDFALLWTGRGHLVAQLPFWSVTPFLLVGGGAIGVKSPPILLGSDVDPAMHWGGGVKIYVNRWIALRLEGRHIVSAKAATQKSFTSHAELLAGLSITLPRAKPKPIAPPNPDRDGDGFLNERDDCPDTPGVSPDGCPPRDSDKDGWVDSEDACPYEAGVEPDGCPIRDSDGDGIPDDRDNCIHEPETDNNYQDEDGCPDEVPEAIREFSGVIEGIEFEYDSAKIRDVSKPILDRAIKVLEEYPDIRIEIVGHTDNQGSPEYNERLSKDRAESVKTYLVEGGVDASRLETRGAGQSEPLTPNSNDTEEGRAKNRRTEFKLLKAKRAGS